MVTFLHAADLHLGLRVTRFDPDRVQRIREARFTALDNLMELARKRSIDFLLIAGDLFDDHAVDHTTANRAFRILETAPVPVFVLSGNHDPFLPGSVWDRPPWNQSTTDRIHVLRLAEPLEASKGVVLFPCPVMRKTSRTDPTAWIAASAPTQGAIRIGVAHGSLRTREDLPPDDHLIDRFAADQAKLDYLALGHWHSRQLFAGSDGVERTAYSGVHEPMRFSGSSISSTGWNAYAGADREEFRDGGKGEVLIVKIEAPGAPPEIEACEVGQLIWTEEKAELTSEDDLSRLIGDVARRPNAERRLLRLKVSGLLEPQAMLRLDELRDILVGRFLLGEIEDADLHVHPNLEQIHAVTGDGILRSVLEKLREQAEKGDDASRPVAERAILALYRVAQGVRS